MDDIPLLHLPADPEPRSVEEATTDRLAMLYVIRRLQDQGRWVGITKLMKVIFLSEWCLNAADLRALNYSFQKMEHGPLSKQVYHDRDYLAHNGFIAVEQVGATHKITPTPLPAGLDEILEDLRPRNPEIFSTLDTIVDTFGGRSARELRDLTHDMEIELPNGHTKKIHDLSLYFHIIDPLPAESAWAMSEEELATLEILLDSEALAGIEAGMADLRAGNVVPFEALCWIELEGGRICSYVIEATGKFEKQFSKLDNSVRQIIKKHIEKELVPDAPNHTTALLYNLAGKRKYYCGPRRGFRISLTLCGDCRARGFQEQNSCEGCPDKPDSTVTLLEVGPRGKFYRKK